MWPTTSRSTAAGRRLGAPVAGDGWRCVAREEEVWAHTSTATQYGGQHSSVYGSAALSSAQQVPSLSTKGAASSALDGHGGYTLGVSNSPKFASGDYVSSSSHGYGHKSDQLYGDKTLDYSGIDRRQYGEPQSGYIGWDLTSDPTARYAADVVGFTHQHQVATQLWIWRSHILPDWSTYYLVQLNNKDDAFYGGAGSARYSYLPPFVLYLTVIGQVKHSTCKHSFSKTFRASVHIAWDDAQKLARKRLDREHGRNDAANDHSELSEVEKEKGDANASESIKYNISRISSEMQL
ncbi:Cell division cycle and apoptosis regulator protein 1 [Sesbania bispinosa]|nr:Cell division cycle and apoptosis regulator protein 1 [Sesbania bispinosa]